MKLDMAVGQAEPIPNGLGLGWFTPTPGLSQFGTKPDQAELNLNSPFESLALQLKPFECKDGKRLGHRGPVNQIKCEREAKSSGTIKEEEEEEEMNGFTSWTELMGRFTNRSQMGLMWAELVARFHRILGPIVGLDSICDGNKVESSRAGSVNKLILTKLARPTAFTS